MLTIEILDELLKNNKEKYENINIPDEICDRRCTFNEKTKSLNRIKFIKEHAVKFLRLKKYGSYKKHHIYIIDLSWKKSANILKIVELNLNF